MKYIENISILIFLIICSVSDIKSKKIYLRWCVFFLGAGILESIFFDNDWKVKIFFGIIPGLLIYAFSIVTKGDIGRGDAFVFMCIGVTIGIIKSMEIFILGLFFTVMFTLPYSIFRHRNLKISVPFIPFSLMAFLTISLIPLF